jgi:endonuclease G
VKAHKSKQKSPIFLIISLIAVGVVFLSNQFTSSKSEKNAIVTTHTTETDSQIPISGVEIPAQIPNRSEICLTHTGYTVSYNPDWKIPNWVAYELTSAEVGGDISRSNHFVPDPLLASEHTATDADYKKSGFDRGHMAPAADMKWSKQAMDESFYFSNICPQNHNLNAGVWENLEKQVRALAAQNGSIFVVCGPLVNENYETIGAHNVAVPQGFFKALLRKSDAEWHSIAFVFDNVSGKRPLSTYAISVRELEEKTGITFFPTLPKHVKSQVDFSVWTVSR